MSLIHIKVVPGAKKQEVRHEGSDLAGLPFYIVKVNARPEAGKANQELLEVLADYFQKPKRMVRLLHGERGREKIVDVEE